jgi:hypothetical protein
MIANRLREHRARSLVETSNSDADEPFYTRSIYHRGLLVRCYRYPPPVFINTTSMNMVHAPYFESSLYEELPSNTRRYDNASA